VPWRNVLAWTGLVTAAAGVVVAAVYVVFWPVSDLIARQDVGVITEPHRAAALPDVSSRTTAAQIRASSPAAAPPAAASANQRLRQRAGRGPRDGADHRTSHYIALGPEPEVVGWPSSKRLAGHLQRRSGVAEGFQGGDQLTLHARQLRWGRQVATGPVGLQNGAWVADLRIRLP
jgi:hypothetical protein